MKALTLRIAVMFIVLLLPRAGAAQDFCAPWIYSPVATEGSQVWFQQHYRFRTKPMEARLMIATTGLVDVYLNGRNVSTALALPYRRAEGDTTAIAVCLDVRRFLQRGLNILAVHYSPGRYSLSHRQLALWLYGRDAYGRRFSHQSDGNFFCRIANHNIMANGCDSIQPLPQGETWRLGISDWPLWSGAAIYKERYRGDLTLQQPSWQSRAVTRVLRAEQAEAAGDSLWYHFPEAFHGRIRVTLRDCKKGELVCVDGTLYRCTGKVDEQLYSRLVLNPHREILITGDANFRREQVQAVEGLADMPAY